MYFVYTNGEHKNLEAFTKTEKLSILRSIHYTSPLYTVKNRSLTLDEKIKSDLMYAISRLAEVICLEQEEYKDFLINEAFKQFCHEEQDASL